MDLFSHTNLKEAEKEAPLAVRMRPRTIAEFVGQDEVVGSGKYLKKMIEADTVPSLILFGPPGTGKTTLAYIITSTTRAHFEKLNAVEAGVGDIRKAVDAAKKRLQTYRQRTVLFIDEIHRFNKNQQDALLPYVENGTVILIGATTENPYFEVNSPLLSRARVIRLKPLSEAAIIKILEQALMDNERGLGELGLEYDKASLLTIAKVSGGDARTALNILEQSAAMLESSSAKRLTEDVISTVVGEKIQIYDKHGDNHYDVVSAFIKSMRGSDPDAALHYLARMIEAGEDVNFIARRIVICASEDVGLADPQALVVAMACAQAAHMVGMPEARIPLAQAVTYIATAPKSNAAYLAIDAAIADVWGRDCGQVPPHLRDASYRGAEKLGHGIGYRYPHDYNGGFVKQQYLPDNIKDAAYYQPTDRGYEAVIEHSLKKLRK